LNIFPEVMSAGQIALGCAYHTSPDEKSIPDFRWLRKGQKEARWLRKASGQGEKKQTAVQQQAEQVPL
jgi:hypothetical protein